MKIENIKKGSWGKLRAFFDITTDEGFVIKGFKLVEGANGLFVGFPSAKGADNEYRDTVYANKEVKANVLNMVLDVYESPSGEVVPAVDEDILF